MNKSQILILLLIVALVFYYLDKPHQPDIKPTIPKPAKSIHPTEPFPKPLKTNSELSEKLHLTELSNNSPLTLQEQSQRKSQEQADYQ
jgi:hypothetical protein